MKLNSLINFLPYEYQYLDTYKVDGKGILERYLEIFGDYFQDIITSDIDNLLDILDIDKTPGYYLNYLWEFLGELPFANTPIISQEVWETYFSGYKDEETMKQLCDKWLNHRTGVLEFDTDKVRTLLKCSIALFKIRGTKQFFEILFRLYGLGITITDPMNQNSDLWIPDDHPMYSVEDMNYGKIQYDNLYRCTQCVEVPITISNHGFTSLTDEFYSFKQSIDNLFRRFLPYNARAKVTYEGLTLNYNYTISVSYDRTLTLIPGQVAEVPVLVTVEANKEFKDADLRYQVSGDNQHWSTTMYDSPSYYFLRKPGVYYFSSVGDPNQVTYVRVTESLYLKTFNLQAQINGGFVSSGSKREIPGWEQGGVLQVTTYGSMQSQGQTFSNLMVRLMNTGEIKSSPGTWDITEPGTYKWQLVDLPGRIFTLEVTKEDEFTLHLSKTELVWSDNPETITITATSKYVENPTIMVIENGIIRELGKGTTLTYTPTKPGVFTFYIEEDPEKNKVYLGVTEIVIPNFVPSSIIFEGQNENTPYVFDDEGDFKPVSSTIKISTTLIYVTYSNNPETFNQIFSAAPIRVFKDGELLTELTNISIFNENGYVGIRASYTIPELGTYYFDYTCRDTTVKSGSYIYKVYVPSEVDFNIEPADDLDTGWVDAEGIEPAPLKTYDFNSTDRTVCKFYLTSQSISQNSTAILQSTGESYPVNDKENGLIEFPRESTKSGAYTFILQDYDHENPPQVILTISKPAPSYTIRLEPSGPIKLAAGETSTQVRVFVTMTPADTSGEYSYDVILDGNDASPITGANNPEGAVVVFQGPGVHTFVVKDTIGTGKEVMATFEILSDSSVQPSTLSWAANDLSEKEVTINTNALIQWTAEIVDTKE